mmetsp:Transcript_36119/g.78882  ORF Transcript_36119/g.78882 Transcript_36119/m.78882 type:complete len:207 (+) Transcript_36119:1108-1728(+)
MPFLSQRVGLEVHSSEDADARPFRSAGDLHLLTLGERLDQSALYTNRCTGTLGTDLLEALCPLLDHDLQLLESGAVIDLDERDVFLLADSSDPAADNDLRADKRPAPVRSIEDVRNPCAAADCRAVAAGAAFYCSERHSAGSLSAPPQRHVGRLGSSNSSAAGQVPGAATTCLRPGLSRSDAVRPGWHGSDNYAEAWRWPNGCACH